MDRGAWVATVHGVAKSWTQLKLLRSHTHKRHLAKKGTGVLVIKLRKDIEK